MARCVCARSRHTRACMSSLVLSGQRLKEEERGIGDGVEGWEGGVPFWLLNSSRRVGSRTAACHFYLPFLQPLPRMPSVADNFSHSSAPLSLATKRRIKKTECRTCAILRIWVGVGVEEAQEDWGWGGTQGEAACRH